MITLEPLYEELPFSTTNDLIHLFSYKNDLMVLNSSMQMEDYGNHSFICFDSFASFSSKNNQHYWNNERIENIDPFDFLNEKLNHYKTRKIADLPSLQGGAVGYFGYEASHYLEELPKVTDNIQLPDIYLNFYSTVISIDHAFNRCWVVATGFPAEDVSERVKKAQDDILAIKTCLSNRQVKYAADKPRDVVRLNLPSDCDRISHIDTSSISSNFTRESYVTAVNSTKNYILNGDIFQANITQQFNATLPDDTNPLNLYFNLMNVNPAPFSAFLKLANQGYIISASPERFIKRTNQMVETCPIKGTRKRSTNKEEDDRLATELAISEKDRAENVMIVDLMRNDISKICTSVHVTELCTLKSFETVHHLVSKITGKLKNTLNSIDVIKATFPPGSVTGAPKVRAMEIISEIEQQARGPYCGCLGYFSFTGDMDTSVIIRTYFMKKNTLFFSAGGAIVLDSNPNDEYQESLTKVHALIKALTS